MRTRKYAAIEKRDDALEVLQWGRVVEDAEVHNEIFFPDGGIVASMGPRR